jgi:hypothetical protein
MARVIGGIFAALALTVLLVPPVSAHSPAWPGHHPGFARHTLVHHGHVHVFVPHARPFHVPRFHGGFVHVWAPPAFLHRPHTIVVAPPGAIVVAPGWYWTGWNWVWVVPW